MTLFKHLSMSVQMYMTWYINCTLSVCVCVCVCVCVHFSLAVYVYDNNTNVYLQVMALIPSVQIEGISGAPETYIIEGKLAWITVSTGHVVVHTTISSIEKIQFINIEIKRGTITKPQNDTYTTVCGGHSPWYRVEHYLGEWPIPKHLLIGGTLFGGWVMVDICNRVHLIPCTCDYS